MTYGTYNSISKNLQSYKYFIIMPDLIIYAASG